MGLGCENAKISVVDACTDAARYCKADGAMGGPRRPEGRRIHGGAGPLNTTTPWRAGTVAIALSR